MYPMKMKPALKDYLWGGTRLKEEYGKETALETVAESWEVSCHPDGRCVIANGPFVGDPLAGVLAAHPEWMGARCGQSRLFPLLIKLIDAEQGLSIQVHPDDAYALREEGQSGKNEMWYVIDAEPGAALTLGLEYPVDREELRRRIADGTITEVLHRVPVRAGDCYCIPAGLLHAIGGGILIAEIQQNSNVTYRVYDYDRRDAAGNPRELHMERALDVIDVTLHTENRAGTPAEQEDGCALTPLTDWSCFRTDLLEITGETAFDCDDESFRCLLAVGGSLHVQSASGEIDLAAGESAFLPAGLGAVALSGEAKVLLTRM